MTSCRPRLSRPLTFWHDSILRGWTCRRFSPIRSNKPPLFVFLFLFKGHFLLGDNPRCIAVVAVVLPYLRLVVLDSRPLCKGLSHNYLVLLYVSTRTCVQRSKQLWKYRHHITSCDSTPPLPPSPSASDQYRLHALHVLLQKIKMKRRHTIPPPCCWPAGRPSFRAGPLSCAPRCLLSLLYLSSVLWLARRPPSALPARVLRNLETDLNTVSTVIVPLNTV